jgi:hypothetical protein
VYQVARWVEDNIPSFLGEGELALIYHAGKLNQAKSEWKDMPNLESFAGIKVGAAIEAFSKEWEACCKRRAKKANAKHLIS